MTTIEKIEARIIQECEEGHTFTEAVTAAAWKAVQEARAKGWPAETVGSMAHTFATVGADMVATASVPGGAAQWVQRDAR
jgi:hypothetical protein